MKNETKAYLDEQIRRGNLSMQYVMCCEAIRREKLILKEMDDPAEYAKCAKYVSRERWNTLKEQHLNNYNAVVEQLNYLKRFDTNA